MVAEPLDGPFGVVTEWLVAGLMDEPFGANRCTDHQKHESPDDSEITEDKDQKHRSAGDGNMRRVSLVLTGFSLTTPLAPGVSPSCL